MVGDKKQKHHNKPNRMSVTEIMVALSIATRICIQTLKHFSHAWYPITVSLNWRRNYCFHWLCLLEKILLGICTGISFIDSTPLRVCRNQRILIHNTFEVLTEREKYSMGYFFQIQVTPDNQWEGWDPRFLVHVWKCGWSWTVETKLVLGKH